MTCVTVDFDSSSVVYGGWAPAELHQLVPQTDVFAPAQKPIEVSVSLRTRLPPSMFFAPFEALRFFWNPQPQTLPIAANALHAGVISCMQVSWNNRMIRRRPSEDLASEQGVWLRFVSTFPHRKYALERSPRQLATFINALRISFPHFLVPACREPDIHAARTLLEFINTHAKAVSAYLPLLYFLFETNDRSFTDFFDSVEELVRRKQVIECNLLDSLKPRVSSWFGWGNPKSVSTDVFSDDLIFMETHESRLPDSFKVKFFFAHARMEALGRARRAAVTLRSALLEEIEAFETAVEFFGKPGEKLLQDVCVDWDSGLPKNQQKRQYFSQNSAEVCQLKGAVVEFMNIVCVLQGQIFGPILSTLFDTVRATEVNAETQYEYLNSILRHAKNVIHNEPLLTGSKCVPKTSQAANNSVLLRQVSEYYGRMLQTFRTFSEHLDHEIHLSEDAMHRSLVLCCTQCFHAFTIFYDVFDARHHTRLIAHGGRPELSIHPLLQLFEEIEEQGKNKNKNISISFSSP